MSAIISINKETQSQLVEIAKKTETPFIEMWAEEIRKATSKEEAQEHLNNFAYYNTILQKLKLENPLTKKELLDLADTFSDLSIYNNDDRIKSEIKWFSETLINLKNELN